MAEAQWHPKRDANRFEPPPWEREQFEALKQAREEREQAAAASEPVAAEAAGTDEAAALTAELAAAREEASLQEAAREDAAREEAAPAAGPEAPAEGARTGKAAAAASLPEAQMDAMLIQLGSEEPKVDEHLKAVGVFGSAVAMFFGVCMLFWGLYALMTARGQLAAVVGALIVLCFGGVFGGLGLWVGWRVTNRGE